VVTIYSLRLDESTIYQYGDPKSIMVTLKREYTEERLEYKMVEFLSIYSSYMYTYYKINLESSGVKRTVATRFQTRAFILFLRLVIIVVVF
jgi:hypothetical protein